MSNIKYYLSWDEFQSACELTVKRLGAVKPLGAFTHIITFARGGLVPAGIYSHLIGSSNVQIHLAQRDERGNWILPQEVRKVWRNPEAYIAIVDEIVDSGFTINSLHGSCPQERPSNPMAVLAPYWRDGVKLNLDHTWSPRGIILPDNVWAVFPWEKD